MLTRLAQAAIITFLLNLLAQVSPPDKTQPASVSPPEVSRLVMRSTR